MTVLPSPIPYPWDSCPWDPADQWYAVARALAGPRDEAFHAAREIVAGYGGTGLTVEAFTGGWRSHHSDPDGDPADLPTAGDTAWGDDVDGDA